MKLIQIGSDRWINSDLVMAVAMRIYSEVLDERIQAFGSVLEIKP